MRLSQLIGTDVVDAEGHSLGRVRDLHLIHDGPVRRSGLAALRVHGLIAGPVPVGARLGYEPREGIDAERAVRGPLPMRAFFRLLHRGVTYIPWSAIREITTDHIVIAH